MSCDNNPIFRQAKNVGESQLINQLEENIKSFIDYGLQNMGGWINVNIPRASIRKDFLHKELVEFTTRSGLLLDGLATSGSCIQYNTLGPMSCSNRRASPNPHITTYTYDSNVSKTFKVIFDPYVHPEALTITASGSAGVVDLIDTGLISGATQTSDIYRYTELIDGNAVTQHLYSKDAFIDTIVKPTGYSSLIIKITTTGTMIKNCDGLTGHYFSICEVGEISQTVDVIDDDCKVMLNIDFDPSPVEKRLKVIASGTSTGNTLSLVDTGFVSGLVSYSLVNPTGYDKIIFSLDPNGHHMYPTRLDADYTQLCQEDLERTFGTTTNEEEYLLNFDAFTDTKKIKIFANSGSSSIELLDTGYISGTNTGLLDCILGENPGDYASYLTFIKPSGYDYITVKFDENNRYDDAFYMSVYTETDLSAPDNTSLYGDLPHQLKTTEVPGYKLGQVWQAFRKDWVSETGITYYPNEGYCESYSPINISGVYVNGNFLTGPTGVAATGYYINYPLGQIVFNKAIPKNSKVELDYSYKWCQVYSDSSDPYWKELQELTYDPSPSINQQDKGDYSLSANHRVQMPCIIVEPTARSSSRPYQIGDLSQFQRQDILLHIFTEHKIDQNKIADLIRLQKDKHVALYDIDKVVNSGVNALNYDGSLNPSGLSYASLCNAGNGYIWNKTRLIDINLINMESRNKNLNWCTLRITSETIT